MSKSDEFQELFEHYRFVADKGQKPLRIDKFLVNRIENSSRNKIQDAAGAGNILVNNSAVKTNYKVKPDDVITIVMSFPPREIEIIPQDIPIDIIYEDSDLLIVNKKPGMVVHPGYGNYSSTLVNAIAFHLQDLSYFKSGDIRAGLVHRIDKNTSGLIVVAKTELAKNKLALQFYEHTIERKYQTLVWGSFENQTGTIEGNIGRSLKDRKIMTVFPQGELGKHAITHYKVLEEFGYISLIECKLETGRTHQIRTHLKYIKHPVFNDETYGGNQILKGTTFSKYKQFVANCFKLLPRQALHAKSLGFVHPSTNKFMFFESDLPEDMTNVIQRWRKYIENRDVDLA
ncbi:MAG: RluA family pseudouridine synthase [Bacteroidetes bacterium]|nr:RluA family pseudouridine synthase [Bacteroidota bacterium]MBT6684809.1 RluA family pseudouridine synthase [Bacteroidota bacterium]MBT7145193.1 RluA family pseudouridine synthase [Bacteroidota bacterium]MBT7493195.1 RluA family pseudouridine synthase [Bacteroidota bacterium]